MIEIKDKNDCCGCEACRQICPQKCISMSEDNEGFLYPHVNLTKCIDCHLCEKTCPIINKSPVSEPVKKFGAINPDRTERIRSSSGGIFVLLAKDILTRGGVVFGARFSDDFSKVFHQAVFDYDDLSFLIGSKYLQSEIGQTFKEAKQYLIEGKEVMFVGTPCQIAGLKNFLGNRIYPKLLTVDILCHGVPSPKVWKKSLQQIVARQCDRKNTVSPFPIHRVDTPLAGIYFRDKRLGWKKYSFVLDFSAPVGSGKNTVSSSSTIFYENPFMKGFLANLFLRPSCHECLYRESGNSSDLTIGDFWGIDSINPEIDDDKGVSLVFANTTIGLELIDKMKVLIQLKTEDLGTIRQFNGGLIKSALPHPRRSYFFKKFVTSDNVEELILHMLTPTIGQRIKAYIKKKLIVVLGR